ncbi:MAG: PEP-CTERM sorting domain-containing protein [Verrucomicrobiae bacterium]|nr:PEP-CTERM sorting domain-containing protein [Verrucomicrobiae bacterium]NNJ44033.1 PEP-CTERM sorting domain-containing protein [Akkermansiaceae bacterium]
MKKTIILLSFAAAGFAQAAVSQLSITGVTTSTALYITSGSIGTALTDDSFVYSVSSPTSPTAADITNESNLAIGDEASGQDVIFDVTVDSITVALGDTLFVDLYGRGANTVRDDSITVEFYDSADTLIGTDSAAGITTGVYNQASVVLTTIGNGTYDSFRIIGGDTSEGSQNYFTLAEVRAAADFTPVPEPSSTALLGLGGIALLLRRRR